jgi:hypothetical protein
MDLLGFEPRASALQRQRSSNWSTSPKKQRNVIHDRFLMEDFFFEVLSVLTEPTKSSSDRKKLLTPSKDERDLYFTHTIAMCWGIIEYVPNIYNFPIRYFFKHIDPEQKITFVQFKIHKVLRYYIWI